MGYFHSGFSCTRVITISIKISFSVILKRIYMLWKGVDYVVSTKKASASLDFVPDPQQGALPPGPPNSFWPL